ncbi:MAG: hypothetical protein Q8O00_06525 [Holophaga sp.]|nr:hypothetical protein [Holophaga sp.]
MRPFIPAVTLAVLLCGCAAPRANPAPKKLYYGTVNLFTDPPGVHVYCDGEYWGETGADKPVVRIYWNTHNRANVNLSLKKRGYKTTPYYLVLRLEHDTREASEKSPQKVVVVMDTE